MLHKFLRVMIAMRKSFPAANKLFEELYKFARENESVSGESLSTLYSCTKCDFACIFFFAVKVSNTKLQTQFCAGEYITRHGNHQY